MTQRPVANEQDLECGVVMAVGEPLEELAVGQRRRGFRPGRCVEFAGGPRSPNPLAMAADTPCVEGSDTSDNAARSGSNLDFFVIFRGSGREHVGNAIAKSGQQFTPADFVITRENDNDLGERCRR